MSKFQFVRPFVPVLLAGAVLIACGQSSQSKPDRAAIPAATSASARWESVIEAPPLAEAAPAVAPGWKGVVEAPPLAEAAPAVASGWEGVVEPPPLAES